MCRLCFIQVVKLVFMCHVMLSKTKHLALGLGKRLCEILAFPLRASDLKVHNVLSSIR